MTSAYPQDSVIQSLLVTDDHPDVQAKGRTGAIAVAKRHEALQLVPEHKGIHWRFRQVSPGLVDPQSYRTHSLGADGRTKLLFARLLPSVSHQSLTRGKRRASGHAQSPVRFDYTGPDVTAVVRMTAEQAAHAPEHASIAVLVELYSRAHVQVTSGKDAQPPRRGEVSVPLHNPSPTRWTLDDVSAQLLGLARAFLTP